ncbi:glucose dehydrogenase [FAD, quinone]-like [Cimex lectularius]|uniref:Glucose-methanol-choline oxidoreductase N-terminal domain-containing protein n=1 Tax=Cimex lectularius TaxID=79782 RepID=A0A8I6R9Z2_CIMLE|nr:glucose dehydrogenase [FAD, quinone]-like [Cimex lectularius]XP_014241317.1 glucose dehydrogenase [FAD, quinone]-like [Cimex lectularius]XP_014241318.1 glucose dehydrogenase [FAD, quinone]-like [Cimex lectularius]
MSRFIFGSIFFVIYFQLSVGNANMQIVGDLFPPVKGLKRLKRVADIPFTTFSERVYASKGPTRKEYDYIVVGSSPSGCVITNRLTENSAVNVLLIEAGYEDNILTDIPILNVFMALTDWNWKFTAEFKEGTCAGMYEEQCPWPSGKGPGGGTILNAMIYTRGNFRDYDNWEKEGNPGWKYNDVLPYFRKVENMMINDLRGSKYHGTTGHLPLNYVPFETPLLGAFLKAGKHYGYSLVDYNNPNSHIGFSRIQSTTRNGERVSAATAYLKPILRRKNFQFTLRSRVTKILIDPRTKRAYGVVYTKEGKEYVVFAKKEVILSAGAFNSPQLLMLSGIGPRHHLEQFNIPVIQDLPVGDNLMEHIGMHGLVFLINQNVSINPFRIVDQILPTALQYVVGTKGILTSLGCEGVAYMKTKYSNSTEDYPDIELLFISAGLNIDSGLLLRKTFGIDDETYEKTYQPIDGKDTFSIWPMVLYPQSRGTVRLKDADPLSKVKIQHNFLDSRIDALILVEAIKIAIALAESPPFKQFGARLYKRPFPQCRAYQFGTDEYWECAVRTITTQFHHQSGTCKMGTVVDSRLRVKGVSSLRVADASIMPSITGGHTQAPAYMIGEKAADLIKQDCNGRPGFTSPLEGNHLRNEEFGDTLDLFDYNYNF